MRRTAGLQIPYLLAIAGSFKDYLPSFPPSPKATFALLRKLDHTFSSLMQGEDSVTGELLPGFQGGSRAGMSKTDAVRCKAIVEATRVMMVDVMSREPEVQEIVDESDADTDIDMALDSDDERFDMDVAKVYEQTIVQLGILFAESTVFRAGAVESNS